MTDEKHESSHARDVRIPNVLGLHARPAAAVVKIASRFESEIYVAKGDLEVNGKSIMGVMMLAAECGSTIRIRAEGSDAVAAVDALCALVEDGFGEKLAAPDGQRRA